MVLGDRMKLASLKNGRYGTLIIVDRKLEQAVEAPGIATSLLQALENWADVEPKLRTVSSAIRWKEEIVEAHVKGLRADQKRAAPAVDRNNVQRGMADLSTVLRSAASLAPSPGDAKLF